MAFDTAALSPLAPSAPRPPAHPSSAEIAALICELFSEGCLSWSEATVISAQPELRDLLDEAMPSAMPRSP